MRRSFRLPLESPLVRAGMEVFVIIAGILLALGADAWWDEQQRATKELELLEALAAEFDANLAEMETTEESHQRFLDASLVLLEGGRMVLTPGGAPVDAVLYLVQNSRTDLNSGVLDGYLELADPGLITDPELRAALEAWPAKLGEVWQQEDRATRLIDEHILPWLVEHGDVRQTLRYNAVFAGFDSERTEELRSAAAAEDRNGALPSNPEFVNLASWRVRAQRDILFKHRRLVERHGEVRALLERAIEERR